MKQRCIDHMAFWEAVCEDCGLEVDRYGNTEAQFDNCCFPDCGCDGSRLCMAPSGATDRAVEQNVEGMYRTKTREGRIALGKLIASVAKEDKS